MLEIGHFHQVMLVEIQFCWTTDHLYLVKYVSWTIDNITMICIYIGWSSYRIKQQDIQLTISTWFISKFDGQLTIILSQTFEFSYKSNGKVSWLTVIMWTSNPHPPTLQDRCIIMNLYLTLNGRQWIFLCKQFIEKWILESDTCGLTSTTPQKNTITEASYCMF